MADQFIKNKLIQLLSARVSPSGDFILSLACAHAISLLHFLENNLFDFEMLFNLKLSEKLVVSKLAIDLTNQNHFMRLNDKLSHGIESFNSNPTSTIKGKSEFSLSNCLLSFTLNNQDYGSVCYHSVGDPFLFNIMFNSNFEKFPFSHVTKNISNYFEHYFDDVSVESRVLRIMQIPNLTLNEKKFLICAPSFSVEHYDVTKNILDELNVIWPKFKLHFGASTCFTDPIFHLIANIRAIPNFGIQHGGGPLSIAQEGINERNQYDDYFLLPPFSKVIFNIRGLKSLRVLLILLLLKLKYFVFNCRFSFVELKELVIAPISRILKHCRIRLLSLYYFILPPRPIIILSQWNKYNNLLDYNFSNSKDNYFLKPHPIDIKILDEIVSHFEKFAKITIYPINFRIENELYKWENSYVIVMNYFVTTLLFLFEGAAPFLIVLNNNQIEECRLSLSKDDFSLFLNLFEFKVIITTEEFLILNNKKRFEYAKSSRLVVINLLSTKQNVINLLSNFKI